MKSCRAIQAMQRRLAALADLINLLRKPFKRSWPRRREITQVESSVPNPLFSRPTLARRGWSQAGAIALASLFLTACAPAAHATVYYVDYQSGSDGADGASPNTPWKHAPGDPLASGKASSIRLQPGDTVRFRGGVAYRGVIDLPASGAQGAPITYAGDQWGEHPAIFEGGDPVESIAPCPSAADCGGVANWANLSLVTFTPPKTQLIKFFDDTGMLFESQYPSAKDPFFSDDVEEYVETPLSQVDAMRQGRLQSPQLAKALANGAQGAQLSIWGQGNWVVRRPITGVAGDTISFDPGDLKPYTDRHGRAAVVSAPGLVEKPGFYAVIAPGKAVIWLRGASTPAKLTIGSGRLGVNIAGRSDVVIRGFVFEHYVANEYGEGIQILNSGDVSSRAVIENNTFRQSSLYTGDGAIMIGKVDGARIVGNTFADLERGSGIRTPGRPLTNLQITGNTFRRLGQTGILAMGVKDLTISKNTMSDFYGIHGNGISTYMDNRKVLVSENRIVNSVRPMTFHGEDAATAVNPGDHQMVIERNFFASPKAAALIGFGGMRDVTIRDNVLIGPEQGLLLAPDDSRVVVTGNQTSGIHVKGSQPSDWVMKDNGKVTAAQLKEAGVR